MNRYSRGTFGASKATNPQCQKCLQRGHYSYECKAAAQERPYMSRPSRTQQLLNPKLAPRLTNTAPEERTRDNTMARPSATEVSGATRRKRSLEDTEGVAPSRKRSRSISSYSSTSVSTISTRSSRTPSPRRRHQPRIDNKYAISQMDDSIGKSEQINGGKRRRRTSSVSSYEGRRGKVQDRDNGTHDRNTRMRRTSTSPGERGRKRSRSFVGGMEEEKGSGLVDRAMDDASGGAQDDRARNHNPGERRSDDRRMTTMINSEHNGGGRGQRRSLSPYSKRLALSRGEDR